VVHFTFENSEDETELRYLAHVSRTNSNEIRNLPRAEFDRRLAAARATTSSSIYVRELPGSETDMHVLSGQLRKLEEQGIEVGLIIVDYGDLMRSIHRHDKAYEMQAAVFAELRDLAVLHHAPVWTASQANRASLTDAWIDLTHIAESYGKAMKADLVLTLCEGTVEQRKEAFGDSDVAEQHDLAAFISVAKYRSGRQLPQPIPVETRWAQALLRETHREVDSPGDLPMVERRKRRGAKKEEPAVEHG
jgi:replicative DNA helicase